MVDARGSGGDATRRPGYESGTALVWRPLMPPGGELARLLNRLQPAESALRDWAGTRLNTSMVLELAALDHGEDVDENRQGIEGLLVAARLPEDLPYHPGEVLSLSSWSEPEDPERRPGSAGWREHVKRLFSCLILLRVSDTVEPAGSLASLVESALELGPEATQAAVRYLAWCRLHEPGPWRNDVTARPFLTLGLLLLYVTTPPGGDPAVVAGLARALVDELDAALAEENLWWSEQALPKLLKLTADGPRRRIWRSLAGRCLVDGPATDADLGARLTLLGRAVRAETTASIETLHSWFTADPRR